MFKIKKLNISITTGGFRVMLNHNDAEILGLKVGDRVKLSYKDKKSLKLDRQIGELYDKIVVGQFYNSL